MEALRLKGNACFASDPAKAAEHYMAAMELYEQPLSTSADPHTPDPTRSLDEYTKSAGNALTCLFRIEKFAECATLARHVLRVNPILAKANAFIGRCVLSEPSAYTGSVTPCEAAALQCLCCAIYELPALEASVGAAVKSALSSLLNQKRRSEPLPPPRPTDAVRVEEGNCGHGVVSVVELAPFTEVSDTLHPFSVGVYEETEGKGCCVHCSRPLADLDADALPSCGTCHMVFYCSPACAAAHTSTHADFECVKLQKLREMTVMMSRRQLDVPSEFFDVAFHCITTVASWKSRRDGHDTLLQLEAHEQDVLQSLHPTGSLILELLGDVAPAEVVCKVIGIIRCNALEVGDASGLAVGQALHCANQTSFFNHSCDPNCAIDGQRHCIRTTRTVAAGEELTIAYLPQLYWPAKRRQERLSEQYFFQCACARCRASDTDAMERAIQMERPGARPDATKHYHGVVQMACHEVRSRAVDELDPNKAIADLRKLLEEAQKHLFPFHYLCHELRNTLTFLYAVAGRAQECLDSCLDELLMWESIVVGALPVKQMKLRNALQCLMDGGVGGSASPLFAYVTDLAVLYDVAEMDTAA